MFYERTKYIKANYYFVQEDAINHICTPCTKSKEQLANVFTKVLNTTWFYTLYNKQGMLGIYTTT